MRCSRQVPSLCLMILLLSGCASRPESCPSNMPVGQSEADAVAAEASLPFRFPLDASSADETPYHAGFGEPSEGPESTRAYHAAEDYRRPAGTPVYAVSDGRVSFSGRAGGYGWLIIVDHPQFNLYSLYGHLSPSRWRIEPGAVTQGALLGYLGDPDENGGSAEQPLEPHLHFGVRAGQRADYPGRGEWRWMAGWIGLCPQDLGWLQPSLVITAGTVPAGGYPAPDPGLMLTWGLGILITLLYSAAGTGIFLAALRKKQRFLLVMPGILVVAAGIVLHGNGLLRTYTLLAVGVVLTGVGIYRSALLSRYRPSHQA